MAEKEDTIEKYLITTIEVLGGGCYKFVVPGRRGYPDRICKLPGGDAFLIEVKRPKGGVLARLQAEIHKELRAVGWRVYLCKDRGEIDATIERERAASRQHAAEIVVA